MLNQGMVHINQYVVAIYDVNLDENTLHKLEAKNDEDAMYEALFDYTLTLFKQEYLDEEEREWIMHGLISEGWEKSVMETNASTRGFVISHPIKIN